MRSSRRLSRLAALTAALTATTFQAGCAAFDIVFSSLSFAWGIVSAFI